MSGVVGRTGVSSGIVGHMGDMVLLRKDRLPSSGAYEITNTFRKEFKTYQIVFHLMKMQTDNTNLQLQFSQDNGSSWYTNSHYYGQVRSFVNTASTNPIDEHSVDHATCGGYGNQGAAGNESSSGTVWIFNPLNDTAKKHGRNEWFNIKYDGEIAWSGGAFMLDSSLPMNACKFYPGSGNFDVGDTDSYGDVSVYGYR